MDKYWEFAGAVVGCLVPVGITIQIWYELSNMEPSTLHISQLILFCFVTFFWTLYGLYFERWAVWVTNGLAFFAQFWLTFFVICGF